ncbi:MAG TPA: hypothetical protein VKE69_06110, partial [Planctomycetota bacterium]|nr:hypothetical protein [Planctomycetota bacterium]
MNVARASLCLAIAAAAPARAIVVGPQNRVAPELRVGLQGGEPAYFSVLESVEARHVLQEAEQLMSRGRVAEGLDKIRPLATGSANRVVRVRFLPGG